MSEDDFVIPEEMKTGFESMEPIKAIEKTFATIDYCEKELGEEFDYLGDAFKPVFIEEVSLEDVRLAEESLGIKLPPSYTKFVVDHGLYKLGKDRQEEFRLLPPKEIGRLSDALEKEWHVDWSKYTPRQKEIMDNIVYFAMGDEQLQLIWYRCFDFNTLNPKTGEAQIVNYDQSDWQWLLKEDDIRIWENETTVMQLHIADMCYTAIESIEDEVGI